MKRKEFFEKLQNLYPKAPDINGVQEYEAKLSKWKTTGKQLDQLYEAITETKEFYPTIAQFVECAQSIGIKTQRKIENPPWLMFDHKCVRYCRHKNELPEGGTNPVVVVENPVDDKPCTLEEGREAFRAGWMSRPGATAERLDEFWGILAKPIARTTVQELTRKDLAASERIELNEEDYPF